MKHFIAYLFCIAVAAAIAVLIDGSGGVMIGLILITALIVSELVLLFFRKKISFDDRMLTESAFQGRCA